MTLVGLESGMDILNAEKLVQDLAMWQTDVPGELKESVALV